MTDTPTRTRRLTGWPLALLAAAVYSGGMALAWLVGGHPYSETALLLRDVLFVLAGLVLVTLVLAWWSGITIHRSSQLGWFGMLALIPVGLALFTFALSAASGIGDRGLIITTLVGTALVGIGEETAYRGIALNSLAERMSLPWAVVFSSILFGLLHAVNVMVQPFDATVTQVVITSVVGLFLGWTYVLSGGNLVLVVVIHWLWDFSLIASAQSVSPVTTFVGLGTVAELVLAMVGTIYGFIVLRRMSWAQWDAVRTGTEDSAAP